MNREQLREKIEAERKKLNRLLDRGLYSEEVCRQSSLLDELIAQYVNCPSPEGNGLAAVRPQ